MRILSLFFLIVLYIPCLSQKKEVGDVLSVDILNFKYAQTGNKPTILVFWNTICSEFIKTIPKLDSLQNEFNNEINILLVCKEPQDIVTKYFAKNNIIIKKLGLITNDAVIHNNLPEEGMPYHVWLTSLNEIKYITAAYNLTPQNIKHFINGLPLSVTNYTAIEANKKVQSFIWQSALNNCAQNENAGITYSKSRISAKCMSLIDLYKIAYEEKGKYDFGLAGTLIAESAVLQKYMKPVAPEDWDLWKQNFSFSYELNTPDTVDVFKYMQADLKRFFDINIFIQYKPVRGLNFIVSDVTKLKISKSVITINELTKPSVDTKDKEGFLFQNVLLGDLCIWLNRKVKFKYNVPLQVDVSGIKQKVDMYFPKKSVSPFSIENINPCLKNYGLMLIEQDILMPVLVLEKRDT